jgi:hypothetical protein
MNIHINIHINVYIHIHTSNSMATSGTRHKSTSPLARVACTAINPRWGKIMSEMVRGVRT